MQDNLLEVTLIRNASIAAPETGGSADMLLVGDRIVSIGKIGSVPPELLGHVAVIDLDGDYLVPGFIDVHVYVVVGGGEGGPSTRTPEITLSTLTLAGVTTVVGVLGTDATTRGLPSLVAKARGLQHEGFTTLIYTGAYQVPTPTLTSVKDDIRLLTEPPS